MADAQDVFVEELDETGGHYRFQGEWRPLERWDEEIRVRDVDPVRVTVRMTHHGPIVRARRRWALALRWERLDTPPGDPTFHALNTAHTWTAFREALRAYSLPPTDFTYADVDGNVGAQSAGCVPLRAAGDGALPVPGASGRYEWRGYVPFEELPSVFRPASGFVVRANQNHDAGRGRHFLSRRWHPPYRARRIRELLEERTDHDVESTARLQSDRHSFHVAFVARRVVEATEDSGSADPLWAEARALLAGWPGQLEPGSAAAAIAKECAALIRARLLQPVLGKALLLTYQRFWPACSLAVERILEREDGRWLPEGLSDFASLYRAVLADALARLRKTFGTGDLGRWRWGALNAARFAHPLEDVPFFGPRFRVPPVETGGDGESVFSSRDAGDWDASSLLLNLGQSGDPRSPHALDHLERWRTGSTLVLPFSWERVEAEAESRLTIPADRASR
jgi:penicillin G amidase